MLRDMLAIEKGDVVCFVGSGGKSSLMLALARELSYGLRVVVTTTTRMAQEELPSWLERVETGGEGAPKDFKTARKGHDFPLAVYRKTEGKRILGILPETVDSIRTEADVVLVEGDGSRRLPVKVPRPSEPVIPACTTKVVVVFGFDGLDRPLSEHTCYNLEGLMERIPDVRKGQRLDAPLVRRIFLEGGFIEAAHGKELHAVINKAELGKDRAGEFARHLYYPGIAGVGIASAKAGWAEKVDNRGRDIVGVMLAAGEGKRFGSNKMLASVDGKPALEHVLRGVAGSELSRAVLVLGSSSQEILERLGNLPGNVKTVLNPNFRSGMSSSIRTGLRAATDAGAVMLLLGDMPFVTAQVMKKVIEAYRDSAALACRAVSGGKPGHPVIIGKELFAELGKLRGDKGARSILEKHGDRVLTVEVAPSTQRDIDLESDLRASTGKPATSSGGRSSGRRCDA